MANTNGRGDTGRKPVKRVERVVKTAAKNDIATNHKTTKPSNQKSNGKQSKNQKKPSKGVRTGKTIVFGIGKIILTLLLIIIITGCIVATAMTVFVMKYVDSADGIKLEGLEMAYTSKIYGLNEAGESVVVQTMAYQGRRSWKSIEEVPDHVQKAVICTEDKRFFQHEGVDWARTFAAFANMGIEMVTGKSYFESGASTITQQLIKNINEDFYDRSPAVKMKEILGALNLERHYTKSKILECYINYMSVGKENYGLQAGAEYFFGKNVSDLSIAEAAALTCTTKSPVYYNMIDYPEKNKERRDWVIRTMLEEGYITQEEHDQAIAEELQIIDFRSSNNTSEENSGIYNWYVDAVIQNVKEDLMKQYGYDEQTALAKISSAGYQIYTPMDIAMQNKLEQLYLDDNMFSSYTIENHPDSAMVIMDYNGNIKAQVGSRFQKQVNLGWNNAYDMHRSMGSCMKPIAAYAPALQSDLIYWSKQAIDEGKMEINGKPWPNNDWKTFTKGPITMADALKKSYNTIPVELVLTMGLEDTLKFLQENLNVSTIGDISKEGPGVTLGMNANGMYLSEIAAAYLMFGNGGYYSEPKLYTQVIDASGKVVLETDSSKKQVLSSDTAFIMNRMLKQVITSGTGTAANIPNIEVVGKTGTGESTDLAFVGCTPYYVSSLWIGYEDNSELKQYGYSPAQAWKNVMSRILEGYEPRNFELDNTGVVQRNYCTDTGLLSNGACPNVSMGYYRASSLPPTCSGSHNVPIQSQDVPNNNVGNVGAATPAEPATPPAQQPDPSPVQEPEHPPAQEAPAVEAPAA